MTKNLRIKQTSNLQLQSNEFAAPNGGKCPHCIGGRPYWLRTDSRGKEFYKCGKCNSEVSQ